MPIPMETEEILTVVLVLNWISEKKIPTAFCCQSLTLANHQPMCHVVIIRIIIVLNSDSRKQLKKFHSKYRIINLSLIIMQDTYTNE